MEDDHRVSSATCSWRIRDRAGTRWNRQRQWRMLWWKMTEMQAEAWAAKHNFEIQRVEHSGRHS